MLTASTALPTPSTTRRLPIETGTLNLSAPVREPATLRRGRAHGKRRRRLKRHFAKEAEEAGARMQTLLFGPLWEVQVSFQACQLIPDIPGKALEKGT